MEERIYPQGSVIELYEEGVESAFPQLFTLTECIGTGASCVAYRANNERGLPVKLKQFRPADLIQGSPFYSSSESRFLEACRQQCSMLQNHQISNITSALVSLYRDADGYPWSVVSNMEGKTLRETLHQNSLYDNLRILLQLAESIRAYHEAGWLLLDIKPENILVIDSPGICGVNFFDFDSFIPLKAVEDAVLTGEPLLLSSTPEYSAPELQAIPVSLAEIGPASDRYSVGAILFEALFQHVPDYSIALPGATYPFDSLNETLRQHLQPDLLKELTVFFRHTLTLSPQDRFETDQELEEALKNLAKKAGPARAHLISRIPSPVSNFKGRQEELEQVKQLLNRGSSPIFLCGFGGIGKTQLVLKLADELRGQFTFYYTGFKGTLRETILGLPIENLQRTKIGPDGMSVPVSEPELCRSIISCLGENHDRSSVLIIDNFDAVNDENTILLSKDPDFNELITLPLTILFTTRCRFDRYPFVEIGNLDERDLLALMKSYLPYEKDASLLRVIWALGNHTLSIDIAARTLKESKGTIKPEALLSRLQENGRRTASDNVYLDHLSTVFHVSNLGEAAQTVMADACLFPLHGVDSKLLYQLLPAEEWDAAQRMERSGWLRYDEHVRLWSMHPLVHSTCENSDEACPTEARVRPFVDRLRTLEHQDVTLRTDNELRTQITEIYANYVRCTIAPVPSDNTSGEKPPINHEKSGHTHWFRTVILIAVLIAAAAILVVFGPQIPQVYHELFPKPTEIASVETEPVVSTPEIESPAVSGETPSETPQDDVTPYLLTEIHDAKLGKAALEAIGSHIEYPREDEYYDSFVYAAVKAPHGHSVYGFGSADHQGSSYTVLDGEEVQILAERNGYSCVILLSEGTARWVNTEHLTPLQVREQAPGLPQTDEEAG